MRTQVNISFDDEVAAAAWLRRAREANVLAVNARVVIVRNPEAPTSNEATSNGAVT